MRIVKPTNKKPLIVVSVLLLLFIAGGVTFAYADPLGLRSSQDMNAPTEEEKRAGNDAKKATIEADQNNKGVSTGSDPLPSPSPDPASGKSMVGVEITAANQNDSSLQIRSLIKATTASGTCTLTMTGPTGQTYSNAAEVQALPNGSTCKGFDVPVSSLGSGQWTVKIDFANDTIFGTTTKIIEIK